MASDWQGIQTNLCCWFLFSYQYIPKGPVYKKCTAMLWWWAPNLSMYFSMGPIVNAIPSSVTTALLTRRRMMVILLFSKAATPTIQAWLIVYSCFVILNSYCIQEQSWMSKSNLLNSMDWSTKVNMACQEMPRYGLETFQPNWIGKPVGIITKYQDSPQKCTQMKSVLGAKLLTTSSSDHPCILLWRSIHKYMLWSTEKNSHWFITPPFHHFWNLVVLVWGSTACLLVVVVVVVTLVLLAIQSFKKKSCPNASKGWGYMENILLYFKSLY